MHDVVIKSRDGLDLVSYLTLPATETGTRPARPLPMVLEVHGGPQWRDGWYYDRDVQWSPIATMRSFRSTIAARPVSAKPSSPRARVAAARCTTT